MQPITLLNKYPCGTHLYHLIFKATQPLIASFHTPGQYVQINTLNGQQFFLAMASNPNTSNNTVEFLVKDAGNSSHTLVSLEAGDTVNSTLALGTGFALKSILSAKALHLFSMGSGIAPFRALIQFLIQQKQYPLQQISLWQGAFDEQHLPFAKEFVTWETLGLNIYRCYDQQKNSSYNGTVPEVLKQKKISLQESVGFYIGSKDFNQAIVETCIQLGMDSQKLSSNF